MSKRGHDLVRIYWEYSGDGKKVLMVEAGAPSDIITGAVSLIHGIAEVGGFPAEVTNAAAALIDTLNAAGFGPLPPVVRIDVDKKPPASS